MKLYNVIIVWDVCAVAESPEAARSAVLAFIRDQNDPLKPSEQTALETRNAREIRAAWTGEKPLVGEDVSDADFELLKGKTSMEIFEMLNTKKGSTK
jgi:hypothetical protein